MHPVCKVGFHYCQNSARKRQRVSGGNHFYAKQLAVQLSILPVSAFRMPENLPQLVTRTIKLPVAGFDLPIEKSLLPVGKCLLSLAR
jgi:hypothetical protein